MNKIKKGDVVGRKSYGNDIIFEVKKILKIKENRIAILKGITYRIEASAPLEDLELIKKQKVANNIRNLENRLEDRINKSSKTENKGAFFKRHYFKSNEKMYRTGLILHLDGDRKYSEKSYRYYKSVGLNAIVKNIPENKQYMVVTSLLIKYKPDILIVTGHDRNDKKWNKV